MCIILAIDVHLVFSSACCSYCSLGLGWKSSSLFLSLNFLPSKNFNGDLLSSKSQKFNFPRACASPSDPLLVKAARGDRVNRPPAWMMRQAGRYMAVYRKLAEKHPSFRERSETTDLIVEISLQPWEAFRPDGVIIFSDILTPLPAFGVPFDIEEVRGPVIQSPICSEEDLKTLHPIDLEKLHFVGESLRILRKEAIAEYIIFQVDAGAHCIQIFDSWGGQLPPDMWERWSKPYIDEMVSVIKKKFPQTPIVLYINGNGGLLERMKGTGVDVIGLDWTVDMADGRKRLGSDISVQGNVDPAYLFSPLPALEDEIKRVVECAGPKGHILNLGHGVLVGTPEEAVAHFFDVARSLKFDTQGSNSGGGRHCCGKGGIVGGGEGGSHGSDDKINDERGGEEMNSQRDDEEMNGQQDPLLVKAARGDRVNRPPAWMMRQAGRYMAVYRKLAEKHPSFRERSETTDLIVEISLQPWEAFRPDGVIIFSDILTPLPAFGVPFDIEEVRGPVIQSPIRSEEDLKTLHPIDLEKLHFVGESLRILRKEAIAEYIIFQVDAGAHCIQIFDSWGGQLPPDMWERWSKPYIDEMVSVIKKKFPQTPIVLYINGNGGLLERMKGTGVDVIGLDWTVDMADGRKRLGSDISVQGNVDPAYLFSPLPALEDEIKRVVECAGPKGHILNLGHGVLVGTPEEAVARFFDVARSLKFDTQVDSYVVGASKLVA
ncbi:Uroporphyrinogen decarboxylase 1 [Abeliophyllum distichum]|uniref:uroporphyrinogen decarboxylase n=1 Tax=Abeliophyllum distichum TaxID=126358 RepID=A0ABD1RQN1_9LAMI